MGDFAVTSSDIFINKYKKPRDMAALLKDTRFIVIDEADAVINQANGRELIMKMRNTLKGLGELEKTQFIFSAATMAPVISAKARSPRNIITKLIPEIVILDADGLHSVPVSINESFRFLEDDSLKQREIIDLLSSSKRALIFCNSNKRCSELHEILKRSLEASRVSLQKVQGDTNMDNENNRTETLIRFAMDLEKDPRERSVLVATDLVSRGVDFKDIDLIIHYDFPNDTSAYIHRVGRACRGIGAKPADSVAFYGLSNEILAKLIMEASSGGGNVLSNKLLNHKKYFDNVDPDAKFPLTGLISRKRSFSK